MAREVVERRFSACVVAVMVVLSRGFTVCLTVVRDVFFCCGWVAVLAFLEAFCVLSARFADDTIVRPGVCCDEIFDVFVRFDAARTVSASSANVVWDTDKPRHTVKNSIILFIP